MCTQTANVNLINFKQSYYDFREYAYILNAFVLLTRFSINIEHKSYVGGVSYTHFIACNKLVMLSLSHRGP